MKLWCTRFSSALSLPSPPLATSLGLMRRVAFPTCLSWLSRPSVPYWRREHRGAAAWEWSGRVGSRAWRFVCFLQKAAADAMTGIKTGSRRRPAYNPILSPSLGRGSDDLLRTLYRATMLCCSRAREQIRACQPLAL